MQVTFKNPILVYPSELLEQAAPEFETLLQTKESVKYEVKSVMKVYVKK